MRGKKIPVLQTYQEKLEQKRDFQRSRNMYDTAVFVLDSSLSAQNKTTDCPLKSLC